MNTYGGILSLSAIFFLSSIFYKSNNITKNLKYNQEFTEKKKEGKIAHPGNAWSSISYAILGLYLLTTESSTRPLSRSIEGALLIWFSWLSFTFHATEIDWIGALDITVVIHLCIACLTHLLGIPDMLCIITSWSITLLLLTNVYYNENNPSNSITVKHMMNIVTPLVFAILYLLIGQLDRFIIFGLGFALKKIDRIASMRGIVLGSINGTSAFHILTCVAMYLHYQILL